MHGLSHRTNSMWSESRGLDIDVILVCNTICHEFDCIVAGLRKEVLTGQAV